MRTVVIAEAGVNHNGDPDLARRLIDIAADAGADFVKFQTFRAEQLATPAAGKAAYQSAAPGDVESQLEMLRRLELSPAWHNALVAHCTKRGIRFLSTGFDEGSVDLLVSLGVEYLKIPSGEITNLPYLRHVGRQQKPVILSTGMATLDEIGAAIAALEKSGMRRERLTVLHCTTAYPAPVEDVNLRAMAALRDAFDVAVGYSDHTRGTEVAIAAVALGAVMIEKHFTTDRHLPGPDHQASLEPVELAGMITAIRNIERALGDGVKRCAISEAANVAVARRSLVAKQTIRAGDVFSEANLSARRPGIGISPMRWDDVVGRRAPRDFVADELIEL